jgi:hypothetical protein
MALSFIVAVGIAMAGAAEAPPSRANLSAEEIVNRNIAARGGLQVWHAVQSISMQGRMGAGGNQRTGTPTEPPPGKITVIPTDPRPKEEIQLPFTMEMQRPNKERIELLFNGKTALQVYNGENGWKLRPYLNRMEIEPFSDDELKVSATQSELDGYLVDHASKGTRVELEDMEKVENRDTYRLKLTLKSGQELHLWIDAQTWLDTKIEGVPRRLDGMQHPVEVYYRDYRKVSGLQIPFVLETKVLAVTRSGTASKNPPVQVERIVIDKVEVNPKLDASLFTKPAIETAPLAKPH